MARLRMSGQGMEAVGNRSKRVGSWYADVSMLQNYWGGGNARAYHHTPPMTMVFALREGLRIVLEEGLKPRITRHLRNARAFLDGIDAMGLALHVPVRHRLPPPTTVRGTEVVD